MFDFSNFKFTWVVAYRLVVLVLLVVIVSRGGVSNEVVSSLSNRVNVLDNKLSDILTVLGSPDDYTISRDLNNVREDVQSTRDEVQFTKSKLDDILLYNSSLPH